MKPIEFTEQTAIIAKDQPEYNSLPAHIAPDGEVVSCWRPSIWERIKILFTGRVWLQVLTFDQRLQPVNLTAHYPFEPSTGGQDDE